MVPEGDQILENYVSLPNNLGYAANYAPAYGKGMAFFIILYPGAMLMKFEGRYTDLKIANNVLASNFINTRVFSLRIAERGEMRITRGGITKTVDARSALLSCYDNNDAGNIDEICSIDHVFNHFIFTESALKKIARDVEVGLPLELSRWLKESDLSTNMISFELSPNLMMFCRTLNLQSFTHPENIHYIKLKYKELFLLLSQDLDTRTDNTIEKAIPIEVQIAKQIVDSGENLMITTQSMADIVEMPKAQFTETFQQVTGMSFSTYMQIMRLEKARDMLQFGKEPIRAIAEHCGYSEVSNFSRAFKNHFGDSPNNIRAK